MDTSDIADISNAFFSPPINAGAILGQRAANGAIVINTKKGFTQRNKINKNIQIITPIGYQQTMEFYFPDCLTQEAKNKSSPDLRTTIYWKPDVTTDQAGKAILNFYSADQITDYVIKIEGTSDSGHLIYSSSTIIHRE